MNYHGTIVTLNGVQWVKKNHLHVIRVSSVVNIHCFIIWFKLDCYSYRAADACEQLNGTFYLRKCYNATGAFEKNLTAATLLAVKKTPPAEEYFTLVRSKLRS